MTSRSWKLWGNGSSSRRAPTQTSRSPLRKTCPSRRGCWRSARRRCLRPPEAASIRNRWFWCAARNASLRFGCQQPEAEVRRVFSLKVAATVTACGVDWGRQAGFDIHHRLPVCTSRRCAGSDAVCVDLLTTNGGPSFRCTLDSFTIYVVIKILFSL